jgi:hypothetical protein
VLEWIENGELSRNGRGHANSVHADNGRSGVGLEGSYGGQG